MIKGQKVKENNMSNYVISCCSTADLTREHMLERNIKYACFHYELDGKEYMDDLGQSMPLPDFYKAMEAGAMTKTSQINQEEYMEYFRQFLDEGYDVLHCTLSSGISGTVNSAILVAAARVSGISRSTSVMYRQSFTVLTSAIFRPSASWLAV